MIDYNTKYWWKEDENNMHNAIFTYVNTIENKQSYKESLNLRHLRLYGNSESLSNSGYRYFRNEPSSALQHSVTLNIVQSMVDTVTSKITKNRPKLSFLTNGGDYTLQNRARKLSKFISGQFQQSKYYKKSTQAFRDACILGTGAVKIYRNGTEVCAERVFIPELTVDDNESIYGEPRQLHQTKYINKDVLIGMFPEHEEYIVALVSNPSVLGANQSFDPSSNMIKVIESWHLPSSSEAEDGLHCISIANKTLMSEPWTKKYFPFVFLRWQERPIGFFGQGISEQLTGLQLEINKILRTIQIAMHLVSVPKLLVDAASKVVPAHLNNKIGGIIKYYGKAPTYAALGSIPSELFMQLDRLYTRAFEVVGVSQLSAQSTKPAGLNSGKALRTYNDLESERFLEVSYRYEQSFIEAAEIFIDLAKDINESLGGKYEVNSASSKFLDTIKWEDVDMDSSKYSMQIFPMAALSGTPADRLSDVQELLAAGFISKEDGMKLLDFPDLEQFYKFNNAGSVDIDKAIELIVEDGVYQTPEPYQNLALGIQKMQQAYLHYRTSGLSESSLELFRRWMEDATVLIAKASTANQVEQAPAGNPNALVSGLQEPPPVPSPLA